MDEEFVFEVVLGKVFPELLNLNHAGLYVNYSLHYFLVLAVNAFCLALLADVVE